MDRNFIPTALAMAGGIALWVAIFPTLFGRKGSDDFESREESVATAAGNKLRWPFAFSPPTMKPLAQRAFQLTKAVRWNSPAKPFAICRASRTNSALRRS